MMMREIELRGSIRLGWSTLNSWERDEIEEEINYSTNYIIKNKLISI